MPFPFMSSAWAKTSQDAANAELAKLESEFGGRIGVYALDTETGAALRYRAG